jgi:hypothetical protein
MEITIVSKDKENRRVGSNLSKKSSGKLPRVCPRRWGKKASTP